MSVFDDRFEFRIAEEKDVDSIMKFIIDYNGNYNHILAKDRLFFEYEFVNNGRVGYFLAIDKEYKLIAASMGVYFYSKRYIPGESDLSGGMLLANPNCKVPMIGIELVKRMFNSLKPRSYISPGVDMCTAGPLLSMLLGHDVSRMKHFYMLGDWELFSVARIEAKPEIGYPILSRMNLKEVFTINDFWKHISRDISKTRMPNKDQWYIEHRYFRHPVYKYKFFLNDSRIGIVAREINQNGVRILRIVDVIGDVHEMRYLGEGFRKLINERRYEYIDIYELGIDDEILKYAGFSERVEGDCNIIPNYFEPYMCENVELYAHRTNDEALCFKADGDQDRPNSRR